MEKAAGEGAPARAIERRQPEREEHGEGYERKKRGRLPPGALREPQRQMPQAPNRPGGKTGREKRNSSLKLRLQDRSPTQFLVTAAHHEGSKEDPHGGDWAEAFREAIGGGAEKNQRLAAIAAADFGRDPMDGALYCFVSRDCEKAKLLRFDVNGWCMHYVRLAEGGFKWRHAEGGELLPQVERRQLPWRSPPEDASTAKAGGLNPRKYLEWLLTEMPSAADPGDPAYLDSLMPWSDSVPEGIRLTPAAAAEAAKMADDPIIGIDPSAFSEDGK